MISAVHVAFTS